MSIKSTRLFTSAAALMACWALLASPARSQNLTSLPGETPLQKAVATAVLKMCVNALDAAGAQTPRGGLTAAQTDLHDQCHAIAVATLSQEGPAGGLPPGLLPATGTGGAAAVQQVSGNQISTQGALATRVVGGQAANISGRLNALRFGASSALSQGRVAYDGSNASGSDSLASVGPQTFYLDNSMLDSRSRGDGYAPALLLPSQSSQMGTLSNTAFSSGGPMNLAPSASSSSDSTGGSGMAPMGAPANPWGIFVQGSYNWSPRCH